MHSRMELIFHWDIWEKTANHISDKAFISRTYKQFNNMKTTRFKTGKGSERTFLQKRYKNNQ